MKKATTPVNGITFQPDVAVPLAKNALTVLERRYLIKDEQGRVIETPDEMFHRVAQNLAEAEGRYGGDVAAWEDRFYRLMRSLVFLPNSPTLMNAGRPLQQLSACFVLPVPDDLGDIFSAIRYQAIIHQTGGGCIAGDARVWTTFCGIEPLEVLFHRATVDGRAGVARGAGMAFDVRDLNIQTLAMNPATGETGLRSVTHVWQFDVPADQQVVVTMREGVQVQTSAWHPFMVVRSTELVEVQAADLQPGDVVLGPERPDTFWPWTEIRKVGTLTIDPDLGWLLGFTLGDGSFGYVPALRQYRVRWFSGSRDVLERVQAILAKLNIHVSIQEDGRGLLLISTLTQRFVHDLLEACGLEKIGPKDDLIRVPEIIAKSPISVVRAFLAGLVDSDGYVAADGSPSYTSASEAMSQDLAALMSLLGYQPIVHARAPRGKGRLTTYTIQLCPLPQVNDLAVDLAPYLSNVRRRERLRSTSRKQTSVHLPFRIWRDRLAALGLVKARGEKIGGPGPCAMELNRWAHSELGRVRRDSLRSIADKAEAYDVGLAYLLRRIANSGQEVMRVEQAPEPKAYYDLTVDEWNTYAAGRSGLAMVHNTGFAFSRLRPKNDIVTTTKGKASGPVSFMQVFDAATGTIKQGGTRRGANMAILSVDHPDIEEFIDMKNDLSVMTNFNVSVALTEKFMEEVAAGMDHELINPRNGAVVARVPARRLFNKIVHNAWQTGEPGIVFIDRINNSRSNPTPALGLVESTNPCVTGDIRLHTQYGLMTMQALYESGKPVTATIDTRVTDEHRGTATRPAVPVFMSAQSADVYRVVTVDGYEVRATEWHDFFTTRGKVKLRDLQVGDKLLVQSGEGQWGTEGTYKLGLLLGLITGDGYITADRGACINLWGRDQELMPTVTEYVNELVEGRAEGKRKEYIVHPVAVPERDLITLRSVCLGRILEEQYGFTAATKLTVPEVIWQAQRECVVGYLHGLFQTDGTVGVSESSETCSIRLASSTPALLKGVQQLLANFGIFSSIKLRRKAGARPMPDGKGNEKIYAYQAQFELIVDGESQTRFMDAVGFPLPYKGDKVRAWAEGKLLRKTQPFVTRVAEIVYEGQEPVYDTTQEDHNTVIFNGLVTGQCGEQPLLPYEACNLGSINLGRLTMERAGRTELDWDALREGVHLATRALENVVEQNRYPIPEIEEMTTRNRRIGVGLMGWADLLFKLRIGYNTPEAVALAERLMQFIDDEALNASEQLAAERGPFANWEESIYGPHGQHWPAAQGVRRLRNSTVTTIAPTGTISIIAGASGGIEPLFSLAFMRTIMDKDQLLEVNEIFEQVAKEEGFYSPALMEEVAAAGTLAHIAGIPDWVKRVFVTARDVTPEWHIRMQAAFQKHTSNAVSKTCNFPPEATEDEVREVYELAYRLGCKGVTIYRDGSRAEQPMSTVAKKETSAAPALPLPTVPLDVAPAPGKSKENGNGSGYPHAGHVSEIEAEVRASDTQLPVNIVEPTPVLPRPLPDGDISGWMGRINSPQGTVRLWVSEVDSQPYEVYVVLGKAGSDLMAFAEGIGRMLSIALRAGIPVEILIDQLRGIGGSRSVGFGPGRVLSVPDAIAKMLQQHYFPDENGGPHTTPAPAARPVATVAVPPAAAPARRVAPSKPVGDLCPECGNTTLMHLEGCKKCPCGHSEC